MLNVNDLVSPLDLAGLPGGPFDDTAVDNAVAQIRGRARWHIAPVRTETIRVKSWGGAEIALPSLEVLSVSAVRLGAVAYTGFTLTPSASLYRPGGWPVGRLEVDLTHGFDECPAELIGLVASLTSSMSTAQSSDIARVTVGAVSTEYRDTTAGGSPVSVLLSDSALAPYIVPEGLA